MKKSIGIVSIGSVGATICVHEIVADYIRRFSNDDHPELFMHTRPLHEYTQDGKWEDGSLWDVWAQHILDSITRLVNFGAEFIVIPCNTAFYCYDIYAKSSPVPILNLIEIAAKECQKKGYKKVAVLGTKPTMTGGLFDSYLKAHGVEPVKLDEKTMETVHRLVADELVPAKINQDNVNRVGKMIREIQCDAVILGCTELPSVYNSKVLGMPVIDTTRLLAHKAVDYSLGINE